MEKRIYITAEEREKCRKAADVFVVMAKGIFAGNCLIRFCISSKVKDLLRIYML